MSERLLSVNADGSRDYFSYDEASHTACIRTQHADMAPLLDRNKAMQADPDSSWSASRDMRHVASVPMAVALLWKQMYGIEAWNKNHRKDVMRLLNDPDWQHLRCSPGRI